MLLAFVPLLILLAISVGIAGFRGGVFDALNLIGLGFAAAVGSGYVVHCLGAPWLVG